MKNITISLLVALFMANPVFAKAKKNTKSIKYTSAQTSSDTTCHVGPRGGRYTITASGNKQYGC